MKKASLEFYGQPTTNPALIRLQDEHARLRLLLQLQREADSEQSEIERLTKENRELRRQVR